MSMVRKLICLLALSSLRLPVRAEITDEIVKRANNGEWVPFESDVEEEAIVKVLNTKTLLSDPYSDRGVSRYEAEEFCKKEDSYLASFHSAKERKYLADLVRRMYETKYGVHDGEVVLLIGLTVKAIWTDGSSFNYAEDFPEEKLSLQLSGEISYHESTSCTNIGTKDKVYFACKK
ncbi:lectin C-type domain protein [Teladorsagia circumcincta]|uniref:Lectin C-type domain protein n=1 Tax=Teladorsagia circumcincta TaxID=45464 RepID=A0A2G9UIU5_TELCI|nr:lectin C-type domain protein [Teladorsagia circumcincta]